MYHDQIRSNSCYNGGTWVNETQCLCDEGFGGRFCKAGMYDKKWEGMRNN